MPYAIMRITKIKSCVALAGAERHGKDRSKVRHLTYPERSKENKIYRKYPNLTLVQSWKKETEGLKVRKNAVYAIEIMLTFSPEIREEMELQLKDWTTANMNWVAKEFGKENILQARYEFDETNLHQHIFVIPKVDGRLCCKHYLDGKIKMIGLQSRYAETMKQFGLNRGCCTLEHPNEPKKQHISLKKYYGQIEQNKARNTIVH